MSRARAAILFVLMFIGQGFVPTVQAQTPPQSPPRHALVIGNSAYSHTDPLRNPANDALLVSGALEKAGFKVQLHVDLTQKEFRKALRDYSRALQTAGNGAVSLIYFAGHGSQVAGRNFLLPTDANVEFEDDVPIETVALDDVMSQLEGSESALNIFVLDACRNNPFKRGSRAAVRGLAPVKAQKGTLVAYSTAHYSLAAPTRDAERLDFPILPRGDHPR